ncbi:MAG: peptidase U32 family protein [Candidatus Cryptobacteroides sp.]
MTALELLAPARNADIGIAAIGCGADAVYIAGEEFGARQAAGNPMSEIGRLCEYAHTYGARVFLTLNTILYDNELDRAATLLREAEEAGIDAVIAQDPAVWTLTSIPVHASTQCAIRTPRKARMYEKMGASRLILEREMSLEQIARIREAVGCELEFFVHGALCVSYSGQCYLSEAVCNRSANRGECIQACRSLYDLVDGGGKVLVRNKALLSLKDYNLLGRLSDLAQAGISSFKIEGRLKNITYVRNVVRAYSQALDTLVEAKPEIYRRASFGKVSGGFVPDPGKTFNRGFTELFLDGQRGRWSSMDAPKHLGEEIGTVLSITTEHDGKGIPGDETITVRLKDIGIRLANGDGFSFIPQGRSEIVGFRGDVCSGNTIRCRRVPLLQKGTRLFRNMDSSFEKEVDTNLPRRTLGVRVDIKAEYSGEDSFLTVLGHSEDGREVCLKVKAGQEIATNRERMEGLFRSQFGKVTGIYSFSLSSLTGEGDRLPLMSASAINAIRREMAGRFDGMPVHAIRLPGSETPRPDTGDLTGTAIPYTEMNDGAAIPPESLSYKANVANRTSRAIYKKMGASSVEDAFEISHRTGTELMRTKYCIRHELGLCPVHQGAAPTGKLFLVNNGKKYALGFDCGRCEMTVSEG